MDAVTAEWLIEKGDNQVPCASQRSDEREVFEIYSMLSENAADRKISARIRGSCRMSVKEKGFQI